MKAGTHGSGAKARRAAVAPTPTGAVIYCRVSTRKQTVVGVGREAQEARCRAHCAAHGWTVLGGFADDGISGREGLEGRPGLAAALEAVKATPGAVLVAYSLSRLARRQRLVWHLLDDREGLGVPFSSATEAFDTASPMGRAMLGMIAVWSALESDLASERTTDALEAVRERGTKLGAPSMVERVGPDGTRAVDPARLSVVRAIGERYAAGGWSHRRLAAALNAEGVAALGPKPGARWHATTVRIALATAADIDARLGRETPAPETRHRPYGLRSEPLAPACGPRLLQRSKRSASDMPTRPSVERKAGLLCSPAFGGPEKVTTARRATSFGASRRPRC
jgi:DNA invertase Pin-like site-specific DNA recombinase